MTEKTRSPLAGLITRTMEDKGLTARSVDQALGYSGGWTSSIKNDLRKPSRGQLVKLAEVLGLDVDDVMYAAGRIAPDLEESLKSNRELVRWMRFHQAAA